MNTARLCGLLPFSFALLMQGASNSQWPNNLVSGTVTFQGKPLAGVSITAFNTNTNTITQVTTTDANGNYSLQLPAWVNTAGTASADYHIWALKPGYAFYPSVGPGATVTRADHTGDFVGNGVTDIAIYFTVIHYVAIPNMTNRGIAGPPLTGANFSAYDGSNPLVNLITDDLRQSRFIDNQDGTVMDRATGLVWLKDAGCFSPTTWADAVSEVHALANGSCGLSDSSVAGEWRLPNIIELESVIDASTSNPAIKHDNPFTNLSTAIYWSSTSYFGGQTGSPNAWAIRFADGRYINDSVSNHKTTANNAAWAVKGNGGMFNRLPWTGQYVTFTPGDDGSVQSGIPPTFPRWVDKGDGTVVDTVTGLVWLKQADCIQDTWANAAAAVDALSSGQCGLTDGSEPGSWHVPSRSEMLSMADRMENNQGDFFSQTYLNWNKTVFQEAIFTNFVRFQYYWTSTPDAADPAKAWTIFSCDFGVYDSPRENVGYTLAVRSPARPRLEPMRRP